MAALYLNTYTPLVATAAGRKASETFKILPFVDGSIRREPDLEHRFPSITCLCRGQMFAPRLESGDVVVYLTLKGYYGEGEAHRRLAAILLVDRVFDRHEDAAGWYRSLDLPVPSNCMVGGNAPRPVEQSLRPDADAAAWDAEYKARARANGTFVVCRPFQRKVNLSWKAPALHDADLRAIFGRVPGTRNPGALSMSHLQPLLDRLAPAPPPVPRTSSRPRPAPRASPSSLATCGRPHPRTRAPARSRSTGA
jgi:hypothetical protein